MYSKLLNKDNYLTFNIDAARILGLNSAVYFSILISTYERAIKKNKLINENYFKIDRKYIFNLTTLSVEDQLHIDAQLLKLSLIEKDENDENIMKIDTQLYASIILNDDAKLIKDITKKVKIKSTREQKETKRSMIIKNLKDGINCSNYELLTALRNWVEAIYSKPNGYLSGKIIDTFIDTLNNYTQGDLDLALRLVEIASIQGYRDCNWAINIYEKDLKFKQQNNTINNRVVRFTEQHRATQEEIDNDIVF